MPFSAPTGFMAPPLLGVFVAVLCSGTLAQGSPHRFQDPSNYSVVVVFWIFVMCAIYIYLVIGVRCCKTWDIHPVLKKMFSFFRYSFCHTSYLPPFPFSATTKIILKHTRYRRSSPGGQLYFVCNDCWAYSRHVSVLSEPCWGCYIMESEGWEFWSFSLFFIFLDTNQLLTINTRNNIQNLTGQLFFVCKRCWLYLRSVTTLHEPCRGCTLLDRMGWTPSRGRSAWWRHPCWMFIFICFIRFPLDPTRYHDFSKLAHPS